MQKYKGWKCLVILIYSQNKPGTRQSYALAGLLHILNACNPNGIGEGDLLGVVGANGDTVEVIGLNGNVTL